MASNPFWQDPNRNTSPSQITQRVFEPDDDLIRVSVVKPIELTVGDIQIGAVEIKDGDTDTRADVETIGAYGALMVYDPIEFQKAKVNIFGSAIVTPGNILNLAQFVVPAGKTFTFSGGIVGGEQEGEFYFDIGGATVALARNSGSNRTIQLRFLEPPTAGAAQIINLKVKNIANKTKQYEATLSGYTI